MKRLKLNTSILGRVYNYEEWDNEDFTSVAEEQTRFDGEKKFCYYDIIIHQESTDIYYKAEYIDFGVDGGEISEEMVQVFPKQETITIYI